MRPLTDAENSMPDPPVALDVLHVMFWREKRTSVAKIVDNIVKNAKRITQSVVSLPDDYQNLERVVEVARPRIIHLHYEREHPECAFLYQLSYQPIIIQTVHSSATSIFTDIANRIVCIDEFGVRNNDPAKSVLIENSVDVEGIPHHKPNNKGVCNAIRFAADQMQPAVIDLFARLNATVYFYGADDFLSFDTAHNAAICEHAKRYENVECLPYRPDLEWKMTGHSFFSYYLFGSNPHRAYGLVVMEAASLGMPIVALRKAQAVQQYIVHGFNGYICDSDDEFLRCCTALLADEALYRWTCANAANHATTIRNSMPDEYEELYLSLL